MKDRRRDVSRDTLIGALLVVLGAMLMALSGALGNGPL